MLHDFAVSLDLDLARSDDVHIVALLARRKDGLARLEGGRGESCIG